MRRPEPANFAPRHLLPTFVLCLLGLVLLAAPTALAASRPVIGTELTAEVGTEEAKLGALVNPEGTPATYRFEYGPTTAYGGSTPFPEGSVGEGSTARVVWAAASGLAPGSTYHYRVAVSNERGTFYGPDQTFTTLTAAQASCPNAELRGGFSAHLPDCRAYELVTPTTKTSVESQPGTGVAAASGDAIEFITHEPEPGAPTGGNFYVSRRGIAGWSPEAITPFESYSGTVCLSKSNAALAFSTELDRALIFWGRNSRASQPGGGETNEQECNAEGLQAAPGEPVGYQNLLLREAATGAFSLVNAPEPEMAAVTPADAYFRGASADLGNVVFTEMARLTEDAPAGVEDLYERRQGGGVRLVTVLPDGTATTGSFVAISAGGSDVLFASGGALYARIDGLRTVQLDEPRGGPGAPGGGSFQAISADGSEVFFTDAARLTPESTAEAGEPDLYECALAPGAEHCALTDLTVAQGGEHADVLHVSGLGTTDASHLYFTARGVLAHNTRRYTDSQGHPITEQAIAGAPNLYLWDAGTVTYIATLQGDEVGLGPVSPDGAWYAFGSRKSLTGYDNSLAGGFSPEEIFLYDAASGALSCVSCQPSGASPIEGGGAVLANAGPRSLADGGRLFFNTLEALVPSDTNNRLDVYEYEAQSAQAYLISGGSGTGESSFTEVSENGDDVFFITRQQLLPSDTEPGARVVYDARVDGGFPEPPSSPPCATADACRAAASPQAAISGSPSSQAFSGAGNILECPKGKRLAKGRCVKKKVTKRHRQHRRHHKKSKKRRAETNRRNAR